MDRRTLWLWSPDCGVGAEDPVSMNTDERARRVECSPTRNLMHAEAYLAILPGTGSAYKVEAACAVLPPGVSWYPFWTRPMHLYGGMSICGVVLWRILPRVGW